MKNITLLLLLLSWGCATVNAKTITKNKIKKIEQNLQTGDLVFQYTNTRIAKITESVTESPVTHVGIVIRTKKGLRILEASRKVKFTSVTNFLRKSKNGWYTIWRRRDALTDKQKELLVKNSNHWIGKSYDSKFSWSSKEIYCTELVYKMYDEIGIKISELETIGQVLDKTSSPLLSKYIKKVYGSKNKVNREENILTPFKLLSSGELTPVQSSEFEEFDTFPYYEPMK